MYQQLMTSFSLAVNKRWTNAAGEPQEKVTWFRCAAWRRQAEACAQYLRKGSKVLVVGELADARTFADRNGEVQVSLEVTALDVKFLSSQQEMGVGGAVVGQGESEEVPF